ncbi:MAG: acyltransferase [Spirosoma sp.]|nr:acyltransferase [Spirosoma sp.]
MGVALIGVPSLGWSIYYTAANPGGAYFVTTTRMWELAIGAVLAILAGRGRPASRPVSALVGWAGLTAIVTASFLFTGALPFPSYTALIPTLGAAAIIWSGPSAGKFGPGLILGLRPMVKVGELSYSLYLWHWPLIVIAGALLGTLSPVAGLIVVAVSFIPAWLSLRFVEKPMQEWIKTQHTNGSKLGVGVVITLVAAALSLVLVVQVTPPPPAATVQFTPTPVTGAAAPKAVGAQTLVSGTGLQVLDSFPSITPAPTNAADDVPLVNKNGCMQGNDSSDAVVCSFGDKSSSKVIALVGDSHAAMLIPGFDAMAAEQKIRVDTYTKGACPFATGTVEYNGKPYDSCTQWVANVTEKLLADKPTAVVTVMSRYRAYQGALLSFEASKPLLASEVAEAWAPLQDAGMKVVSVRDLPRPDVVVPDCVAQNSSKLSSCALPRGSVLWGDGPEVLAARADSSVTLMDLTPAVCTDDLCPVVIDGILVYRDSNHLTASYARTLNKQIEAVITPLLR